MRGTQPSAAVIRRNVRCVDALSRADSSPGVRGAKARPRLLAAPDKFRGTAGAPQLCAVIAESGARAGWDAACVAVSDGGDSLLDAFGGANRSTVVSGPLGTPVDAPWRLDGERAVLAMSEASGLRLVAGINDPLGASTRGTGQLVRAAIEAGAREVLLGVGGSATTDGGSGALELLAPFAPLDGSSGVRLVVAADVSTRFVDAARMFAAQKGASPDQIVALTARLERLAEQYRRRFGIDVSPVPGSGAAGGLAGGLVALGAVIRPGFEVVAAHQRLRERISGCQLVVTGEGRLDRGSTAGKAPIGVARLAAEQGVACLIIAGSVASDLDTSALPNGTVVASLVDRFGIETARTDVLQCVATVAREHLAGVGRT